MPTDDQLGSFAPPPISDDGAAAPSPFAGVNWGNLGAFVLKNPSLTSALMPAVAAPIQIASGMQSMLAPSQDMQDRAAIARGLPESAPQVPAPISPGQQVQPPAIPGAATGVQNGVPTIPGVPNVSLPGARDYSGQIDSGLKMQQQGAQQAAAAEAAAAQVRAQTQADVATQQLAQAKQSQAVRDAAFADVNQKMATTQKQMEEAANEKVDPNHWWSSRNGAQKASALLGLALSNFGAAFSHQQPVNLIGQEIDRDIAAQRENIANKRQGLAQQANLYERQYQIFGNHQDATDMTKAHMLEGLARQGEAAAQQAAVPAIADNALKTAGELTTQAANLKSQVAQRQFEQQYQAGMLKLDAYGKQIQANQLGLQKQQLLAQKSLNIGGQQVYIPDDKTREKIAQMVGAGTTLKKATEENAKTASDIGMGDRAIHALSEATFGAIPDATPYAKMNAAQEAAAVSSNKALGADTAQTEQQYKNMRSTLDSPNNPNAASKAGKVLTDDAKLALYQQLAQVPTIGPQRAAQIVAAQYQNDEGDRSDAQKKVIEKYGAK